MVNRVRVSVVYGRSKLAEKVYRCTSLPYSCARGCRSYLLHPTVTVRESEKVNSKARNVSNQYKIYIERIEYWSIVII